MTEEEKKAIDIIKYNDIARPLACGDVTICNVEDLKVVLNLIQRQETENIKLKQENEKKDKIIDEMANSFVEEGFYSEHCQTLIDNDICTDDCNKCVKQYFERKVEQ